MNKVAMIIPYIGKFPKYFDTTIYTYSKNQNIDWFFFTDQPIEKYNGKYKNIFFNKITLEEIKYRAEIVSGKRDIECDAPYKLCDYRPLYGEIFNKYVSDYQYWGYCDIDTVFGDIEKFINGPIQKEYDKIGNWGHFTIIRNTPEINHRYMLSIKENGHQINLFNKMTETNDATYFDETSGINKIYQYYGFENYINKDLCGDILYENLDLYSNDKRFVKSRRMCFLWNKGKTYLIYKNKGKILFNEYGYIHLQKRKVFTNFISNLDNLNTFVITTTGYHPINKVNKETLEYWMDENHSSFDARVKYLSKWYFKTNKFTDVKIGNVYLPIKHILWRILKQKDFRI
ncbi:DUF6625 family protein [Ligilactobacillus araffinosus]|nr:DUF6625 family protein [Ligilactobacillus araffinosus]